MTGFAMVVLLFAGASLDTQTMENLSSLQSVINEQSQEFIENKNIDYILESIKRMVEEQRIEEEKEKLLNETMTEGFIQWIESLHNIRYRLGRFDADNNSFDCVGLFKAYAIMRGLLDKEEVGHINSTVMYKLGEKKTITEAKRGDVTFRLPIGADPRHIAIISRDYNEEEGGLRIIDNLNGEPKERFIKTDGKTYAGKWRVFVASSPFVAIAKAKKLEYTPMREYMGVYNLSRYYAPTMNQTKYFGGSYEADKGMNCGEGDCLVTANGYRLTRKDTQKVVACPQEYKLGTTLRIDDIEVVCQDRGGAIDGKRLDIRSGIGMEGLRNIRQNKVITGKRNVYKLNTLSKPLNTTSKKLYILDSKGNFIYK